MRIHKLVFTFLALIFLVSCSDENNKQSKETSVFDEKNLSKLTEDELKVLLRMRNPKNRVSIKEAEEQTDWVINFMNVGGSGEGRKISSISALTSDNAEFAKALKSKGIEVPDTLIYVVNFADSLGFAIISADTRIDDPLIGFSGSGSLKDSIDNPGMVIFLEHLEDYMQNSIIEAERQKDSLIGGIWEKLDAETGTKASSKEERDAIKAAIKGSYKMDTTEFITPLVHVEWNQEAPFNNNLKNNKCPSGKNKAGCTAVAVAHIMSYWNHPDKIGKYSFDWAELNKYTGNTKPPPYYGMAQINISSASASIQSQVANLMERIGNGVNMNYGCKGSYSGTKFSGAKFLLENGFLLQRMASAYYIPELINYDSKKAIASMKRREPLIISGCDEKINNPKLLGFIPVSPSYDGCHEWVIDGLLARKFTITNIETKKTDVLFAEDYINHNWGWWDGGHNGYFKSGVFDAHSTPINPVPKETKSNQEYNFQYNVKMTPYIRRK